MAPSTVWQIPWTEILTSAKILLLTQQAREDTGQKATTCSPLSNQAAVDTLRLHAATFEPSLLQFALADTLQTQGKMHQLTQLLQYRQLFQP